MRQSETAGVTIGHRRLIVRRSAADGGSRHARYPLVQIKCLVHAFIILYRHSGYTACTPHDFTVAMTTRGAELTD